MIQYVGSVDYQFVGANAQVIGRALCPYCLDWHRRATGEPVARGSDCKARYARVRRVAIVVRGKPVGFGSGFRVPDEAEIQGCLVHAANIVN